MTVPIPFPSLNGGFTRIEDLHRIVHNPSPTTTYSIDFLNDIHHKGTKNKKLNVECGDRFAPATGKKSQAVSLPLRREPIANQKYWIPAFAGMTAKRVWKIMKTTYRIRRLRPSAEP